MKENQQIYESNLSCLKINHPDIYKTIESQNIEVSGTLVSIKKGVKNLKITGSDGKDYFIHGESGPAEDTEQFLKIIQGNDLGVLVIMGFGLGLPCLEIIKKNPQLRHFFIFELDPGIFKQALFANDLSELLSDPRVVFCLQSDPVLNYVFANAFRTLELENIQILKHGPSFRINPGYEDLSKKLFSFLNSYSISGSTTKTMGKKFLRNRFKNLKHFRNDVLIDSLNGIFNNIPAVLVSGGPSLDKNIDQLKNTKGRAVLFAVDSVVPSLLKKGFIPDFVTAIDPQNIAFEKFKGATLPPEGISLICSTWVTSKVPFHLPAERVIWTFGRRNIDLWINHVLGGTNSYIGAGTVAHLNLHAALDMGCDPIIFVGQDLAYSETKDHAENVSLNNNKQVETYLKSENDWTWVKGINGGQIKTSRSFHGNKVVFEGIIQKNHSVRFINATEGGAHIEGTEAMKLKDVLNNMPLTDIHINKEVFKKAVPLDDSKIDVLNERLEELVNAGSSILKEIKASNRVSLEIKKTILELKKKQKKIEQFSDLTQKTQKKIKKMDAINAKIDNQGAYWHILDEVTYEGLKQSEKMLFDIRLEANNKSNYLNWISKNIERLEYINGVRTKIISWFEKDILDVLNFHKKEKELIPPAQANEIPIQDPGTISKFYFEHGITESAIKYLQNVKEISTNADLLYIKGCSLAICGDMVQSTQCFEKAILLDQNIKTKIDSFKQKQATEYYHFANKWNSIDLGTSKRLFVKGLQFNKNHIEILEKLDQLIKEDLEKISFFLQENEYISAKKEICQWTDEIEKESLLKESIENKKVSLLYRYAGKISVLEENYELAYNQYIKAAESDPNNPENYVQLTDLCFTVNDYDKGVTALNVAVQLDRSNAKYWEIIGDNMIKAGNLNDAVSAYEKCFLEMPEKTQLLIKIGETYTIMGNPEAAQEAYRKYEKLTKPIDSGQ